MTRLLSGASPEEVVAVGMEVGGAREKNKNKRVATTCFAGSVMTPSLKIFSEEEGFVTLLFAPFP